MDPRSTLKISDEENVDYNDMILIDNLNEGTFLSFLF